MTVESEGAAHWRALAAEATMWGEYWEATRGDSPVAFQAQAELYERAAKALDLQAETGESHCTDHLKPRSTCLLCELKLKGGLRRT